MLSNEVRIIMADTQEKALLDNIYRNAEMGRDGLYYVIRRTDDPAFRKAVEIQLMEYQSIMDEAEEKLRQQGDTPTGSSPMSRAMVRMTAACKTARDNSPAALADMLIQGSSMGVTKILRQIRAHESRSEDSLALANRLRETEENNIRQMKQYL